MSKFKEIIESVLKERGVTLKHTMNNLEIDSPICSCFITAYTNKDTCPIKDLTDDQREKYNIEQNNKLENKLRALRYSGVGRKKIIGGYTYQDGKIGEEPGFLVSCKPEYISVESFKEEMLSLGEKFYQRSILLKLPGEKAAYYTTMGDGSGKIENEFGKVKRVNPKKQILKYPKDKDSWVNGYTQLKKDKERGKDRAIELVDLDEMNLGSLYLTEEEINQLPGRISSQGRNVSNGMDAVCLASVRSSLGLPPYECYRGKGPYK